MINKKFIYCFFVGFFFVFACSAIILIDGFNHWHDQQRVAQVALCAACALISLCIPSPPLPRLASVLLFFVFLLGAISVIFALYSIWALYEWATFLGLFFIVAVVRHVSGVQAKYSEYILAVLVVVSVVNSLQFLAVYFAAIFTGLNNFDAYLLYSGFSNPRFLNQFQALALPFLAYFILRLIRCRPFPYANLLATVVFLGFLIQWIIAFTLGGRGLWLALIVSNFTIIIFFPRYWRLIIVQLVVGLVASLFYYLMFTLVPEYLEVEPKLWDSLRSGLSARETIWKLAWDIFVEHPWLGVGPMHFAAYVNPVAAHPHQVILQWLAEWGVLATSFAVIVAGWGMISALKYIRKPQSELLDVVLWVGLLNALVLAQVDGVFVMPYTQTWLAIMIGVAWARMSSFTNVISVEGTIGFKVMAILALVICLKIVFVAMPKYLQMNSYSVDQKSDFAPRFWSEGFIPHD